MNYQKNLTHAELGERMGVQREMKGIGKVAL